MKKLSQLRVKLKELQPPDDVTPATKRFVKKHYVAKHDDPAGNDDSVFDGSNVKKAKRYPDHGYEPGQDADIYENFGGYGEIDAKNKEGRRLRSRAARMRRNAADLKDDHRTSRVQYGHQLDWEADRMDAKATRLRQGKFAESHLDPMADEAPLSNEEEFSAGHTYAHDILDSIRDALNKHEKSTISTGNVQKHHIDNVSGIIDKLADIHNHIRTSTQKTTSEETDLNEIVAPPFSAAISSAARKIKSSVPAAPSKIRSMAKPTPTLPKETTEKALKKTPKEIEDKFSRMATHKQETDYWAKRRNFKNYWKTHFGADVELPESVEESIYNIFDELTEENKFNFISILSEENGLEKITEAFGLEENEDQEHQFYYNLGREHAKAGKHPYLVHELPKRKRESYKLGYDSSKYVNKSYT